MKRNYWIALLTVLIVIAAGAGVGLWRYHWLTPPTRQAAAPPAAAPANPAAGPEQPSFDAVHVGPDGNAVIAGRAAPGSQVTVMAGGKPVGQATADDNGEWVIMTQHPLPEGPQSLSLSAQGKDGTTATSSRSLALVVPPHGTAEPPVAVLLPHGGEAARSLGGAARAPRHFALDVIEYDADGRTVLSGRADPGTAVGIAVDGKTLATATAGTKGEWSASLAAGVPAGPYHLALKGRLADGGDAGEFALDLRRPGPDQAGDYLAIVPGNDLWRLAERSYGSGLHYVEIFRANQGQINNPNLIYPGQVLALPAEQRNP
jgi:hypothetical protein